MPPADGKTDSANCPTGATASDQVALGVIVPEGDPAALDAYIRDAGRPPALVLWYEDWAHGGFDATRPNATVAHCALPIITWEPWNHDGPPAQPDYALRNIGAGKFDAYITQWAKDAAAWGKPLYIRFAHEMNLRASFTSPPPYPWNQNINGNTYADYGVAWRRVVDIFRQQGAKNVRWIWSPNVIIDPNSFQAGTAPFSQLYPGDGYVDWVGLDGYNWGTSQPSTAWAHVVTGVPNWRTLGTVFGNSYKWLEDLTKKPMMITETASTEQGGSKGTWITQAFTADLPQALPHVRAVLWFNYAKETDWRVNSSQASLEAFKQVAASSRYQGRLSP